jgi:hypothetical protein
MVTIYQILATVHNLTTRCLSAVQDDCFRADLLARSEWNT